MTLVEKILKALDASDNNETKLSTIKALALEEIRLQALNTTPGKTKLSATLTRMYKDAMKSDSDVCHGYIKTPAGFAVTNSRFMVLVDGDPLEFLPVDAMKNKKLTWGNINHLLRGVEMYDRQDITVNYSDIVKHIKTHGRKKTKDDSFFTVPGTEYSINVFYLEYAFKLAGEKELTFFVQDPGSLWFLQYDNWSMIIAPMVMNHD